MPRERNLIGQHVEKFSRGRVDAKSRSLKLVEALRMAKRVKENEAVYIKNNGILEDMVSQLTEKEKIVYYREISSI